MLKKGMVILGCAALAGACTDGPQQDSFEVTAPLYAKGGNAGQTLKTHMTGAEEVLSVAPGAPTPADSRAQGQAVFRVRGDNVDFTLIAANIENVTMAHIHCGRFGENGPPAIWLHPVIGTAGAPGPSGAGPHNGVLNSGSFSAAGVMCAAANVGSDMTLLEAMRAGLTYVNVHTNDGVGGSNTGPGDFPGGEVRGQID